MLYLRFQILQSGGAPATIDTGNWLAFGDLWLGEPTRSTSIVYPPVVPLLAKAFVAALGRINGVAALAALSSLAPSIGMYVSLRYLRLGSGALVPALLVLGPSAVGEATAWGGFPQLIGLGLAPVLLVSVDRWLRTWRRRDAIITGFLLMLLLATSHFVGFTVALAMAALGAMTLISPIGSGHSGRHEAISVGFVLLPMVWLIPMYLVLGESLGGESREFRNLNLLTWSNLLEHIEFLYRDFPWIWRIVLSSAVVTPFLLIRRHQGTLWRVTTSLIAATAIATLFTREGRFLYFLTVIGALVVAQWTVRGQQTLAGSNWRLQRGSRISLALGFAVVISVIGWQIGTGIRFFEDQREYYGILSPGIVEAIEFVDANLEQGGTIAVTSLQDAPLGWWVEAITKDKVLYGSPLRWLTFDEEIERARLANQIFAPPFPTQDKLDLASSVGVDYMIIPTRWGFFDSDAMYELQRESPESVPFKTTDALVLIP